MDKFFNPDETYDKAIKNKNVGALRALLTGIIGSDPTFATSEFEEAQTYIRDKSMELNGEELILNENFKQQESEVEKTIEEWDEHYFQMNLVWLRNNFNLSNRLPKIKRIGEVVYRNKKTWGKFKIENRKHSLNDVGTERERRSETKKQQAVRITGSGVHKKSWLAVAKSWLAVAIEWVKVGIEKFRRRY